MAAQCADQPPPEAGFPRRSAPAVRHASRDRLPLQNRILILSASLTLKTKTVPVKGSSVSKRLHERRQAVMTFAEIHRLSCHQYPYALGDHQNGAAASACTISEIRIPYVTGDSSILAASETIRIIFID